MARTTHRLSERKAKKSDTLSLDSIDFLESVRNNGHEAEMADVNQSVTAYYDSLSDEEMADLGEWGKFGLNQLLKEDT